MKRYLLLVLAMAFSATASWSQDDDWPCVQRLVPEISPAILWPDPLTEDDFTAARANEKLQGLAAKLATTPRYSAATELAIDNYLDSFAAEEQPVQSKYIFLSVLDRVNQKRKKYISGIKRYTRGQKKMAEKLEEQFELQSQETVDTPIDESSLKDSVQLFSTREGMFSKLCEQPVKLEEYLSEFTRYLQNK